jgi:hypothetical protein
VALTLSTVAGALAAFAALLPAALRGGPAGRAAPARREASGTDPAAEPALPP